MKTKDKTKNIPYSQFLTQPVTVDLERIRQQHIFIAVPCYGGMMGSVCARNLIILAQRFAKMAIKFTFCNIDNESLITRARNVCVANFLSIDTATHLMFIDGDIEFTPDDILRMLHYDRPVLAGAYPMKSLKWNEIRQSAQAGVKAEHLEVFSPNYVVNFEMEQFTNKQGEHKERMIIDDDGLMRVKDAGTGFMMIKRDTIMKMVEHYPELKYENDMQNMAPEVAKHCHSLFDTMHCPETNRYLSEDYTFCRRWQQMGGHIWIDPRIQLNHWGNYLFKGNVTALFKDID